MLQGQAPWPRWPPAPGQGLLEQALPLEALEDGAPRPAASPSASGPSSQSLGVALVRQTLREEWKKNYKTGRNDTSVS